MLNIFLIILFLLAVAVCILFIKRGKASSNNKAIGVIDGKLAPCSSKPNCVCSEFPDNASHYVEPINVKGVNTGQHFYRLRKAIEACGGKIQIDTDDYVAATFTSRIFKFVDDVEIRLDKEAQKLHIRSASREGFSDLGVNRKRVAKIIDAYKR